jgi:arylsulfatase A-like enzyme
MPGAPQGLQKEDPTIAELLKPLGYVTGQFGKNHLGDRNEFFPTVHGFDEFFGNLYHLNVEEEPELPDYPTGKMREIIKPRGVFKCQATDTENPEKDPRFGAWGKQVCEDTGPLTQERMKTVGEEFLSATKDFIKQARKDDKPFFVWFNATRMHVFTHLKEKLLKGYKAGNKTFKVHLDGYNMLDYFNSGGEGDSPRKEIFYFTDVGELAAVRYEDYKVHFMIQEAHGFDVWKNPYTPQSWPSLVNLRADPFERGMHESIGYSWWATRRMFSISAAAVITQNFLKTFLDFPPRQEPGSFSVDKIIQKMEAARAGNK